MSSRSLTVHTVGLVCSNDSARTSSGVRSSPILVRACAHRALHGDGRVVLVELVVQADQVAVERDAQRRRCRRWPAAAAGASAGPAHAARAGRAGCRRRANAASCRIERRDTRVGDHLGAARATHGAVVGHRTSSLKSVSGPVDGRRVVAFPTLTRLRVVRNTCSVIRVGNLIQTARPVTVRHLTLTADTRHQ